MTLVTVLTPTWRRHQLLMDRCVQSVYRQTHTPVEHIVVSDGPDRDLADVIAGDLWRRPLQSRPLRLLQLAEHLSGQGGGPVDYGSRARNYGLQYAGGKYVAYLDDDNAYRPEHLSLLIGAMDESGADFGYSRMLTHPNNTLIGHPTPVYGGIDTSLIIHRRGVPERYGMWPLPEELTGDKHAPDWGVVERWLNAGATWVHLPEVTVDYYFPSLTVRMTGEVTGLRDGQQWPPPGTVVDLPAAEAAAYIAAGLAVRHR